MGEGMKYKYMAHIEIDSESSELMVKAALASTIRNMEYITEIKGVDLDLKLMRVDKD